MIGITGDPIWLHNIPGRPPIAWFVAPFFSPASCWHGAKPPRALAWTIAVMIWPASSPCQGRRCRRTTCALVIAPAVFLLAGFRLMRVFAIGATDANRAPYARSVGRSAPHHGRRR
ncbi:MAG: hypothetical protein H6643_05380 [Caldilineaceae bacterium]|nr:hypothetical protein [Caldilineaceae bacterium]